MVTAPNVWNNCLLKLGKRQTLIILRNNLKHFYNRVIFKLSFNTDSLKFTGFFYYLYYYISNY